MPPSTLTPALPFLSSVAPYSWLLATVALEIGGTLCLAKSLHITRPVPTAAMLVLYTLAFYCLTQGMKAMPFDYAYAVWTGLGIALTVFVGGGPSSGTPPRRLPPRGSA